MPFVGYEQRVIGLGGSTSGRIGSVRLYRPDSAAAADFYEPPPPLGLSKVDARSTNVVYDVQAFSVGGWSDNVMFDQDHRFLRQGIVPWDGIPTVVATAGPGPSGSCRAAIRFRDSFTGEVSPASAYTAAFTQTNQQRAWSGLPTVGPEDEGVLIGLTSANATTTITSSGALFTREAKVGDKISLSSAPSTYATILSVDSDTQVTVSAALGNGTTQSINVRVLPRWDSIDLLVEMDSGLTRVAATIPIGVTSYTEGVATLALGEAITAAFERLPRGTAGTFYHERQWVIDYSDTAYASALFEPERHEGMKIRTKNGEQIIAIVAAGNDKLLLITPINTYSVHGYTNADVAIDLEDAEHGGLNQWCTLNINGNVFVPGAKTISMYDNIYHNILEDSAEHWAQQYKTFPDFYEDAFAVHDPDRKTYELYVVGDDSTAPFFDEIYRPHPTDPDADAVQYCRTLGWIIRYPGIISQAGGGYSQPDLLFDVMERATHSGALMYNPGARRGTVYFGGCDGFIRKRDENNSNDDSDLYGKRVTIRSRAEGMGEAGGDAQEGKDFYRIWSFMETEKNATRVIFHGGDESAWTARRPDNDTVTVIEDALSFWGETIAATNGEVLSIPGFEAVLTKKTTHIHPVSCVTGRYVTGLWTALSPDKTWRWRGWGGMWQPGPADRPALPEQGVA